MAAWLILIFSVAQNVKPAGKIFLSMVAWFILIFFLVVPCVMILTAFLVRRMLNLLGVRIFYPTLAMCVVMSFLVDVLAAILSPNPDKWYFFRLFALIFVAAAAVTALNKFLVDNENRHD